MEYGLMAYGIKRLKCSRQMRIADFTDAVASCQYYWQSHFHTIFLLWIQWKKHTRIAAQVSNACTRL